MPQSEVCFDVFDGFENVMERGIAPKARTYTDRNGSKRCHGTKFLKETELDAYIVAF
jgi:hypothetical protein